MKRKLLSLLLAGILVLGCAIPAFAEEAETAEETEEVSVVMETIEIQTAEEFLVFARNCILDTWSQNKQVVLTADISLAGKDFQPIATFGGSFEGNGHTISGLLVADEIVPAGLFRYLQPTAVVKNLNVQGTVIPSGDANFVGGIVGHNNGVLEHVTFSGTVEGSETVGGIAGYNNGTIRKCSAEGSLTGEKSTGGIAGYNTGLIESCENRMAINTESVDPSIDPTDIDLDFTMDVSTLMNRNTSTAASDTGGICGYSAGIILGCRNTATIGYPHIGYNLGGSVGRNCGYVAACENTGTVYGRKDVGGIAGQIEPDIATILSPDYLQKLSDQFEQLGNLISSAGSAASAAGGDIQSYIQTLAAYENQAKAALNSIYEGMSDAYSSGELPDLSGFSSLASAIQGMVNTTQSMGQAMGNGIDSMMGSFGAISGQVNSIAKTFEMATEEAQKEAVTDVSDADIAEVKSGKVYDCGNEGFVQADINAGGIVGVMGLETEFDPEDDLDGGGTFSQRRQYELKAIVQACTNTGEVETKQNYAGGICGRMELGLITASENYGPVTSTGGDYVGGIAGIVGGTIRGCYAKCTLSGIDYIGGIAGSGVSEDITGGSSLIADCCSMVEIEDGGQYIGAISGGENGTYTGNTYVSDTLGGVNGVSYFALAEPIAYETLLNLEGLPAGMKKLTLTFVAEEEPIKTLSFDYGASFDHTVYPAIPEKEGHYARWDNRSLTDLRFDTIVTVEYFPYITALNSTDVRSDGNPVLFVQGQFQEGDALTSLAATTDFAASEHQQLLEHLCISIPADGLESHTIRYLPTEDCTIYILKNGNWARAETEEMGSYLAFSASGATVEFAAVAESIDWLLLGVIAAGILLIAALLIFLIRRKRNMESRKPKAGKKKWIFLIVSVLILVLIAALLYLKPHTQKAVQTIRAYDILTGYLNQPEQSMELKVTAKVADQELDFAAQADRTTLENAPITVVTENDRTLYYADGVVFLSNGAAYKLNSDAPDYSLILNQVAHLYSLVDVEAVDGIYTITAEGSQAKQLLELLMPAAKDLLSDANRLTVDLITVDQSLQEIHFMGAGNLADSVKTPFSVSAVVNILTPGIPEIPEAVAGAISNGNYQAQQIYTDDVRTLIDAWRSFKVRNPIGAQVEVSAQCGPINLGETFDFYQWKLEDAGICALEKDGNVLYFTEGVVCDAEGHAITTGTPVQMDVEQILSLVYDSFRYTKFQCEETEGSLLYTATLDQEGMKQMLSAVVPQSAEMEISYEAGSIQLIIRDGEFESITIICGGGTKIGAIDAAVHLNGKILFMKDSLGKELPDAVKNALINQSK